MKETVWSQDSAVPLTAPSRLCYTHRIKHNMRSLSHITVSCYEEN